MKNSTRQVFRLHSNIENGEYISRLDCSLWICQAGCHRLLGRPANNQKSVEITVAIKNPKEKGWKKAILVDSSICVGENCAALMSEAELAILRFLRVNNRQDCPFWIKAEYY